MREALFIKQNAEHWKFLEQSLRSAHDVDPDRLGEWYVRLTDDLSYARTFYPESKTTQYLNQLAVSAHQAIYRNRPQERGRFITFWTHELPLEVYRARRELLYALVIFLVSIAIGALSAANDEGFARLILSDEYVNMTMANIESGDPLAVYKGENEVDMFLTITLNNIRVSFIAFIAGVVASVGTAFILLQNGVMVGTFAWFLADRGLAADFFLTVFLHGTLELAAIVVAGGAGLVMGNGLLFPGTFGRLASFMRSARRGMKLVIGLVPIFVMAGFIEGFITRHNTAMPVALSLVIILGSLAFLVWYFIVLPHKLASAGAADSSNGGIEPAPDARLHVASSHSRFTP